MGGRIRLWGVIVAASVSQAAEAAELGETLCKTATGGTVSPLTMRSQALEGVSLNALDLNQDASVSADEVLANLAGNTCGNPSSP